MYLLLDFRGYPFPIATQKPNWLQEATANGNVSPNTTNHEFAPIFIHVSVTTDFTVLQCKLS